MTLNNLTTEQLAQLATTELEKELASRAKMKSAQLEIMFEVIRSFNEAANGLAHFREQAE